MKLGEAKERVLKLLDEYSSNGDLTPDIDIDKKMNAFFDMAQIEVSRVKGLVKQYVVPLEEEPERELVAYEMPADFDRLIRLWADLQLIDRGRWIGKSLILSAGEQREIVVEYFALPTPITEETPDEYELELAPDAQDCMIYYVAAQQLMSDVVMDNSRLLQLYNQSLERLSPPYESGGVEIVVPANSGMF